ncbi:cilia- and flagella-associated protein 418-like [Antedon mediterranea]|uniref:cilia- and flagella-associated protein 418-like n=1 Tax=Antedon mediterranea TaxID=105859 RepID=UPI003AF85DFC
MADDLDDLLDEVEGKFCKKPSSKAPVKYTQRSKNKTDLDEDISAIIDDVDEEEPSNSTIANFPTTTNGNENKSSKCSSSFRKCFPVYLGGSSSKMGASSSITQKSCDQLRCTSCDFKVVFFDDYVWHSTCDYLFLRNNVPDFQKLKSKLKKEKGTRAYACQCKWKSIKHQLELSIDHELNWVCGKHTT